MNYSPIRANEAFRASLASIYSVFDVYRVLARSDQIVNVCFKHDIHVCIMGLSSTPAGVLVVFDTKQ